MSWRDRLRPASFRGVRFHFDQVRDQAGRWTVRHDYPNKDLPFVEDLGKRAREIRLRAYLVGDDYLERLDALLDAVEEAGPGELVHPTLGSFSVVLVEPAAVEQSTREGGFASVDLSFVEAEGAVAPFATDVPGPVLEREAALAAEATTELFAEIVVVDLQPEAVREAMAEAALPFAELLQGIPLPAPLQELAAWRARLDEFVATAVALAGVPTAFGSELHDLIHDLLDLSGPKLAALAAYERLLAVLGVSAAPGNGTTARVCIGNARAADNLCRMLAFSGACSAAAGVEWSSLEQALAARDRLQLVSDELEGNLDDRDLQRLRDLRSLLARAVPPPDRGLPRERSVYPAQTVPSLVLAYQLDASVLREPDLVERNRPRHPGFLPGGRRLEVLDLV